MRARECACLRVSLSVCDRGRADLGVSACAGASVCRSVRGALSPALLARSLPNRPTKCAWAAESRAQLPGLLDTPKSRLRPAPGRACAAPRELRRARPLGGVGVGSSGIA